MTEAYLLRRELMAARTELAQLRRLERIADSDLVRLALSAWAAVDNFDRSIAHSLETLPAVISNQGRRTLRRQAMAVLSNARAWASVADDLERRGRPADAERIRFEAVVLRFKATVLLAAAKEAR
jgi:hypothetical protein